MFRSLVLPSLLALATIASAQSSFVTAPDGYLARFGHVYGVNFGTYYIAGVRAQHADPTLRKGKPLTLVSVDWRPQADAYYDSHAGMGRRFSVFTLKLGHCDTVRMTSVFASNYLTGTSATTVYSGTLTLPTVSGYVKPSWGGCGRVPFQTVFQYDGKHDVLQDWSNTGAVLANGYTRHAFIHYYCDGAHQQAAGWGSLNLSPEATLYGTEFVPRWPNPDMNRAGCADGVGYSRHVDAFTFAGVTIYSDSYATTSLRSKFSPWLRSYYTAKGSPVLAALTVGGSSAGIAVGARCHRLHANMGFVVALSTKTADKFTGIVANHLNQAYGSYSNAVAGAELYAQSAWKDSKTGQLALTIASRLTLPRMGAAIGPPRERVVYRWYYPFGSSKGWSPHKTNASYGTAPFYWGQKIDRYGVK